MRVLAVVQRYGPGITGGAERSCAELSERLVRRGHTVDVLTTDAVTYGDWQRGFAIGTSAENGVVVTRLTVGSTMDRDTFEPFNQRVIGAALQGRHVPLVAQREWLHMVGPVMPDLPTWIDANLDRFDVVCVHTLGYWHATATIEAVRGRRPVVLHPLAHEEPNFALPVFDHALVAADAFAYLTPEEEALITGRVGVPRPGVVIGLGVGLVVGTDEPVPDSVVRSIRSRLGLAAGADFAICAGRVDRDKGVHALAAGWEESHRRGVDLPVLVIAGPVVHALDSTSAVRVVGSLEPTELAAALSEAVALVHPSVFESFGIVLTEAWARGTPTLVNARCDVLVGQCRRSGGGLAWHDLAELHEQVSALRRDPNLRSVLGQRGREHASARLGWDDVLDRYEGLLASVVAATDPTG